MSFDSLAITTKQLLAGEKILWEGSPSGDLQVSFMDIVPAVFGTIFFLHGLSVAVSSFPVGFLAPQLWFGIYVAIGRLFFERKVRRNTRYLVSNSKAIEERLWPNPSIRSVAKFDCEIRIEVNRRGVLTATFGVLRSVPFAGYGIKRILPMRFENEVVKNFV